MKPLVVVVQCSSYEASDMMTALEKGLSLLSLDTTVFKDSTCVLKPNLLMPKPSEAGVTTHPSLVQALACLVQKEGGNAIIGDSPGGPFNRALLSTLYGRTGMKQVAEKCSATLNYNLDQERISFPQGVVSKAFTLTSYISSADYLINLPKMKTHGFTRLTGAVKNLFGVIPGLLKAEYHLNLSNVHDFSRMLVDLARAVPCHVHIVDGVVAMEGAGPSGGDKKRLNRLILSRDPFALDVALAHMMNIEPQSIPTIRVAGEVGLPSCREDIEILGDLIQTDFKVPTGKQESVVLDRYLPSGAKEWIKTLFQPRPEFLYKLCIGCEICEKNCPPDIINGASQCRPQADLEQCIRCFCCQELCPHRAIVVKRPWLGKLLLR